MALPHIGEPGLGDGVPEAAQRIDLDHDAELVILADKGDLGIDDPYAGARLYLHEAEFLQQDQCFPKRRKRQAEKLAKLILGDDHAGL